MLYANYDINNNRILTTVSGGLVVEALRYTPAGPGFNSNDTIGVIGIFQGCNPFGRTTALGSSQPLTEKRTRCIFWR